MGEQTSIETWEITLNFKEKGKSYAKIGEIAKRSHNTVKKTI